jgi:hypothetical protein
LSTLDAVVSEELEGRDELGPPLSCIPDLGCFGRVLDIGQLDAFNVLIIAVWVVLVVFFTARA